MAMSSLLFGVFFVLLVVTGIFYFAGTLAMQGIPVAQGVCYAGAGLCQYPGFLAVAAGGTDLLWITMRD
jgi:hypothetical protein